MWKRKWPWMLEQQWDDLLFIHWPVPHDLLRPYVPQALELETYNGQAWIGVIPFRTSKNRPRMVPYSLGTYVELNVRTYVRFYDEPGVYFFSLDASNFLTAFGANVLLPLPYYYANMQMLRTGKEILFTSRRRNTGTSKIFKATYCPYPHTYHAKENTLTYWLTERYCLYTLQGNRILKGPITHSPWLLQDASYDIEKNEYMPQTVMEKAPLVHYSKTKKAYFHPFEVVGRFSN